MLLNVSGIRKKRAMNFAPTITQCLISMPVSSIRKTMYVYKCSKPHLAKKNTWDKRFNMPVFDIEITEEMQTEKLVGIVLIDKIKVKNLQNLRKLKNNFFLDDFRTKSKLYWINRFKREWYFTRR